MRSSKPARTPVEISSCKEREEKAARAAFPHPETDTSKFFNSCQPHAHGRYLNELRSTVHKVDDDWQNDARYFHSNQPTFLRPHRHPKYLEEIKEKVPLSKPAAVSI
jgi:hypothetical protein